VIILGSGKSILSLSPTEIAYVNRCKTVIALNKFTAFYKKSGIVPTHVFFLDSHDNSLAVLRYVLSVCRRDRMEGMTFIFDPAIAGEVCRSLYDVVLLYVKDVRAVVRAFVKGTLLRVGFFLPRRAKVEYAAHNDWLSGGEWARDLSMPLYHYRGSLTSALNYAAIVEPGRDVYLVGTDFDSDKYFFQEELDGLRFATDDWTAPLIAEHKRHFSVIDYQGKTIYDALPFIKDRLCESANRLWCVNAGSLLVTQGGIEYKALPV
jgi:hypothetical protein